MLNTTIFTLITEHRAEGVNWFFMEFLILFKDTTWSSVFYQLPFFDGICWKRCLVFTHIMPSWYHKRLTKKWILTTLVYNGREMLPTTNHQYHRHQGPGMYNSRDKHLFLSQYSSSINYKVPYISPCQYCRWLLKYYFTQGFQLTIYCLLICLKIGHTYVCINK